MRAPKSLRPMPVDTTYINEMESLNRRYTPAYSDIALPISDLVATLGDVMLDIQQRVHPAVTIEVEQHRFGYIVYMRWQSPTDQLQLMGVIDRLGLTFRLTNSLGALPWKRGRVLASWNCSRSNRSHDYGDLKVDRFEDNVLGRPKITYLATDLPIFEKVMRGGTNSQWWQNEPLRPDLVADIAAVTQAYASVLV